MLRTKPSRLLFLIVLAVLAAISLGYLALVIEIFDPEIQFPSYSFAFFGATIVAAVFGAATSPLVAFCLWRTDLRISMPIVYGSACLITIVFTKVSFSLGAAFPAFFTVCLCSVLLRFTLPRHFFEPGRCPGCGYPAGSSPVCTECGKQLRVHRDSPA